MGSTDSQDCADASGDVSVADMVRELLSEMTELRSEMAGMSEQIRKDVGGNADGGDACG